MKRTFTLNYIFLIKESRCVTPFQNICAHSLRYFVNICWNTLKSNNSFRLPNIEIFYDNCIDAIKYIFTGTN